MTMRGFKLKLKPLQILTEEQIKIIHRGTLEVLEETGLRIEHERALKMLKENGCEVDFEKKRVHFPPELIEKCLRKAPSSFHVKTRDPKNNLILGGNTVYFANFLGMQTVNLDTWEPRTPTRKEFYDGVTVLDALDNVHFLGAYSPYYGFEGVPEVMKELESTAGKIRNSTKFQLVGTSKGCEMFQIKMAKAVGVDILSNCLSCSPPLTYYAEAIEAAFRFVEAELPVHAINGDVMGGTAPATIAGSMITGNAEVIAGVVLIQLIKLGAKTIVTEFVFPQNMRTGSMAFGQIGVSLHQAIFNQIWRKYDVPILNNPGLTSSKQIDFQCGYEKAISALTAALSGANMIALHGGMYGELAFHPLQAILDDDIVGMIGRFIEGVEVNDETLAIDLINEVGPIPGFYLDKEHTRKWWKKEQFVPKVADRLPYPEWMKTGKKSAIDYARERLEEILATHNPRPLAPDQEEAIENNIRRGKEVLQRDGHVVVPFT